MNLSASTWKEPSTWAGLSGLASSGLAALSYVPGLLVVKVILTAIVAACGALAVKMPELGRAATATPAQAGQPVTQVQEVAATVGNVAHTVEMLAPLTHMSASMLGLTRVIEQLSENIAQPAQQDPPTAPAAEKN